MLVTQHENFQVKNKLNVVKDELMAHENQFFLVLRITFCTNFVFMTLARQLFYIKRANVQYNIIQVIF